MTGSSLKHAVYIPALIIAMYLFSGCASPNPNISQETLPNESEGLLITKVHTNWRLVGIFIMGEGDTGSHIAKLSGPNEDLKVIAIKGGRSFISLVKRYSYPYNYLTRPEPKYFVIEPGTATYIGDLFINWVADGALGAGRTEVTLVDMEAKTMAEAKEKYPWVFERYPYRKSSLFVREQDGKGQGDTEELGSLIQKISR